MADFAIQAHDINGKKRTSDIQIEENFTFADINIISDEVLSGLTEARFLHPSPIQMQALPLAFCGLDLIVQAKSGTGKTLVFALTLLNAIKIKTKSTQGIVLAPTREIAYQITNVIRKVGEKLPGIKVHTFIGGTKVSNDKKNLECCHIAVGTPGRMKQLLELGLIDISNMRFLILDEADQLLSEDFRDDIIDFHTKFKNKLQIMALSATYSKSELEIVESLMSCPEKVMLNSECPALLGIDQFAIILPVQFSPAEKQQLKFDLLVEILNSVEFNQCLVFLNSQMGAETIYHKLKDKEWPVTYLTGAQDQETRLESFRSLCTYQCRVLVSTDLSARGLDSENVDLVINVDIPSNHATYMHRIGRAGRFGSLGCSISFLNKKPDYIVLNDLQEQTRTKIIFLKLDMWKDIICKRNNARITNEKKLSSNTRGHRISSRNSSSSRSRSSSQTRVGVGRNIVTDLEENSESAFTFNLESMLSGNEPYVNIEHIFKMKRKFVPYEYEYGRKINDSKSEHPLNVPTKLFSWRILTDDIDLLNDTLTQLSSISNTNYGNPSKILSRKDIINVLHNCSYGFFRSNDIIQSDPNSNDSIDNDLNYGNELLTKVTYKIPKSEICNGSINFEMNQLNGTSEHDESTMEELPKVESIDSISTENYIPQNSNIVNCNNSRNQVAKFYTADICHANGIDADSSESSTVNNDQHEQETSKHNLNNNFGTKSAKANDTIGFDNNEYVMPETESNNMINQSSCNIINEDSFPDINKFSRWLINDNDSVSKEICNTSKKYLKNSKDKSISKDNDIDENTGFGVWKPVVKPKDVSNNNSENSSASDMDMTDNEKFLSDTNHNNSVRNQIAINDTKIAVSNHINEIKSPVDLLNSEHKVDSDIYFNYNGRTLDEYVNTNRNIVDDNNKVYSTESHNKESIEIDTKINIEAGSAEATLATITETKCNSLPLVITDRCKKLISFENDNVDLEESQIEKSLNNVSINNDKKMKIKKSVAMKSEISLQKDIDLSTQSKCVTGISEEQNWLEKKNNTSVKSKCVKNNNSNRLKYVKNENIKSSSDKPVANDHTSLIEDSRNINDVTMKFNDLTLSNKNKQKSIKSKPKMHERTGYGVWEPVDRKPDPVIVHNEEYCAYEYDKYEDDDYNDEDYYYDNDYNDEDYYYDDDYNDEDYYYDDDYYNYDDDAWNEFDNSNTSYKKEAHKHNVTEIDYSKPESVPPGAFNCKKQSSHNNTGPKIYHSTQRLDYNNSSDSSSYSDSKYTSSNSETDSSADSESSSETDGSTDSETSTSSGSSAESSALTEQDHRHYDNRFAYYYYQASTLKYKAMLDYVTGLAKLSSHMAKNMRH